MNPRFATFTVRGRVVLGSGAAMAVTAWLFGIQELFSVALAAAVLAVGARLWVDFRRWDLQVSRFVHPTRVAAGQEARVELAVRNLSSRVSPPVEARDPFDGGRRWARFAVAPVGAGEARTSSYRLPSTRRGVHRLGPLELRLLDPLGLASCSRATAVETSLTVHPRYDIVPVQGVSSHRDEERRQPRPVLGKGGNEFYTLREYVPGDDLRHVHWRSTARVDDLVIRQPENLRRGRLTVVGDLRSSLYDQKTGHNDETLEAVLSAVASLAMSSLRSGLEVRVVTTAGWDSGHGTGRGHGPAILDGLAAATVHRAQPGVAPFRLAGRSEPVVIVTTDRCRDGDLESAFGTGGPTGTTLVLFETHPGREAGAQAGGAQAGGARIGRRRLVRVGHQGSFATAWTAYTRASVSA
jgi:uncharacterized protein (DUF58 family)